MCSKPAGIDARDGRLVDIDARLNLKMASLAKGSQVPEQQIPFVSVQVVNRQHVRRRTILGSTEFTLPTSPLLHPP